MPSKEGRLRRGGFLWARGFFEAPHLIAFRRLGFAVVDFEP